MPGNFGWIYWVDEDGNMRGDPPQGPEVTTLEPNLTDNYRSGPWYSGDKVHGDVGVTIDLHPVARPLAVEDGIHDRRKQAADIVAAPVGGRAVGKIV